MWTTGGDGEDSDLMTDDVHFYIRVCVLLVQESVRTFCSRGSTSSCVWGESSSSDDRSILVSSFSTTEEADEMDELSFDP